MKRFNKNRIEPETLEMSTGDNNLLKPLENMQEKPQPIWSSKSISKASNRPQDQKTATGGFLRVFKGFDNSINTTNSHHY